MKSFAKRAILTILLLGLAGWLGWAIYGRLSEQRSAGGPQRGGKRAAPVEVSHIVTGKIIERRTFTGTLEATAEFIVAPKVAGRVTRMAADVSDRVKRNRTVAELDSGEFDQALVQAEADKKVAQANQKEAENALEIASRELTRIETLEKSGVTSASQLDVAKADQLAKTSQVEVAKAQVARAEALVEAARIRQGYTKVQAAWTEGDDYRVVAERFVDEGEMVSANTPLMRIVEMNPITGVIYATEKDYTNLERGQSIDLWTDSYPGETFKGAIERIAPVFRPGSRQARIELTVANEGQRLKPGMFIRARVVLREVEGATIVPARALITRDDRSGVFVVNDDGKTVRWVPVTVGIREGERVQVTGENLTGLVVTLGQQLIDNGSEITIPHAPAAPASQPSASGGPATRGEDE